MKLYNTLTKTIEGFNPLVDNVVQMYTCGPTVYDHAHIGNLSAYIYADTLKRTLKSAGFHVKHVMNITDIDDKTIKRSLEKYSDLEPKEALKRLTREYEEIFMQDMRAIGNSIDDIEFIRATDAIPEMQVLINTLYEDGFAYVADDGIYFSIEAYKKSGKVYGQLTLIDSSNTSQARIANDEYDKESAHDFALWKFAKSGEPSWNFILDGKKISGRPGWHIECSAMSSMELGVPFDIHTGGVDLIFPHHENEIAQSTAGKDDSIFASTFFHSEHLLVDGKKMSKSANNFYTVKDLKNKGYDPLAFRLMVLQSHYRNQSNFTWDNLEAAQIRLKMLRSISQLRYQGMTYNQVDHSVQAINLKAYLEEIYSQTFNNVNIPEALARINDAKEQVDIRNLDNQTISELESFVQALDTIFGLNLMSEEDISTNIKFVLADRQAARDNKNWDKADMLRNELKQQGIGVKDTPNGQIWSRI